MLVSIYQTTRRHISWGSNSSRYNGDSLKTDNIVAHCIAIRKAVVRNILLWPIILQTDWNLRVCYGPLIHLRIEIRKLTLRRVGKPGFRYNNALTTSACFSKTISAVDKSRMELHHTYLKNRKKCQHLKEQLLQIRARIG